MPGIRINYIWLLSLYILVCLCKVCFNIQKRIVGLQVEKLLGNFQLPREHDYNPQLGSFFLLNEFNQNNLLSVSLDHDLDCHLSLYMDLIDAK